MNWADKEQNVINDFSKKMKSEDVLLLYNNNNNDIEILFNSLISDSSKNFWIDNSSKSAPPPDFLSEELEMMMEMMRIDDHGDHEIGNLINKTESQIHKEIRKSGILDSLPNAEEIRVISNTELDTQNNHNYVKYKKNFRRIVQKHIDKICKYRDTNPQKKLVFFILDESTAYLEQKEDLENRKIYPYPGKEVLGSLHFFFFDKDFVEVFISENIDYVVWYAPYKLLNTKQGYKNLPKAIIYDLKYIKKIKSQLIKYSENRMISSER